MPRATTEFEALGVRYRARELSAVDALSLLINAEVWNDPVAVLRAAEAEAFDVEAGAWVRLDCRANINRYVRDVEGCGGLPGPLVLNDLLLSVRRQSLDELETSRPDFLTPECAGEILRALTDFCIATEEQLREVYSLRDAFRLIVDACAEMQSYREGKQAVH